MFYQIALRGFHQPLIYLWTNDNAMTKVCQTLVGISVTNA